VTFKPVARISKFFAAHYTRVFYIIILMANKILAKFLDISAKSLFPRDHFFLSDIKIVKNANEVFLF